jgi:serine/threonine protein kinase/beta-lactam-binding protein with PASTA domain
MFQIVPGTIIDDRYQVVSRVGSGGMAEVYCAEDLQLGRRVAVKLLHERFAQDEEFVERFRREASSAASLSHANIVSVFDRGEWGGTYYIAMELLEGRSLDTIVREEAPLTPERAIGLTEQVLLAARFAHKRGVVHRDLKPHNVIIDDEGRVKVTDFGIARAGASEITQTGSIMGTARYLSPEQAQGESVGPRSDLYAVGILLYELLTGTVPFEGDSVVAIALRHLSEPPRPPSNLVSSISPNLDAIVLKSLAKNPADRFADADEFIAALAGERDRLRTEDGSRTAAFTPLVLPSLAPGTAIQPAQTLLPAAYGQPDPAYWDPNQTSVIPGGYNPQQRNTPVWPFALIGVLVAAAAVLAVVFLLINKGKTVPAVTGETSQQATAALAREGFQYTSSSRTSTTVPANIVIAQTPTAGSSISKGSTVAIVVSSGVASKGVPDVSQDLLADAERVLHHKGFHYTASPQPSTTVKSGYVISSSPTAGSTEPRGSTVSLLVSSGPPRVFLANVVGLLYPNAQSTLIAEQFLVHKALTPTTTVPAGTVVSEVPSSKKAPQGSVVVLTVAELPQKVTVPNVTAETQASAISQLTALGLVPSTTTEVVTDPTQQGLVQSQSPTSGYVARPGKVVDLVIGAYQAPATTTSSSGPTGTSGST